MLDSVTAQTVACQAPVSLGFSRYEYSSELPFPLPGDLPDPGIEPALAGEFFTAEPPGIFVRTWNSPTYESPPPFVFHFSKSKTFELESSP